MLGEGIPLVECECLGGISHACELDRSVGVAGSVFWCHSEEEEEEEGAYPRDHTAEPDYTASNSSAPSIQIPEGRNRLKHCAPSQVQRSLRAESCRLSDAISSPRPILYVP